MSLFSLGATVVHRMVARAALTDSVFGAAWRPDKGVTELPFERPLAQVIADNVAFLEDYEANGGSPAACRAAALTSNRVP